MDGGSASSNRAVIAPGKNFEIGRFLHLKSEIRNLKLDPRVQFEISDLRSFRAFVRFQNSCFISERELHRQLGLTRIADALTKEPVEIEQTGRNGRIHVVVVVEGVEHLDLRDDREAVVESERPLKPPIEREKLVVLAQAVAIRALARFRADRLRRMRLHPGVGEETFPN